MLSTLRILDTFREQPWQAGFPLERAPKFDTVNFDRVTA
jgi:hypothetical protein